MSGRTRHIGYVLKRFPRISETFVAAEIIELERQGERVSVFAISRPEERFTHAFVREMRAPVVYLPHRPLRELGRIARAVVRAVRADHGAWFRAAATSLWPPRAGGIKHLMLATVLRDEMRITGIDHAHAHFANVAAAVTCLARRMGGPTYSVTAHAKDIYDRSATADRVRRRLDSAEFVATVSSANRDHLEAVLAGRVPVHVVHNAVRLERLGRPHGRPEGNLVLTVARLVEKKGIADLVAACEILARRGMPARLEIVGDGPLRSDLERRVARSGVQARFHGALPHEEVLDLYRRAGVFCLPCVVASSGDRDGLPTSVLEAMALGVPVVTTAVNGLSEVVIHDHTGLVVPERDPTSLAAALELVLRDRDLGARLATGGRDLIERRFTLERSVTALRALFPEPA